MSIWVTMTLGVYDPPRTPRKRERATNRENLDSPPLLHVLRIHFPQGRPGSNPGSGTNRPKVLYVETIRPGYPDCVATRYIGRGKWEDVRIEFEFRSSDFARHRHYPDDCDAIVCWEDDWKDRPDRIEVIELRSIVAQLSNPVLDEPDKISELSEHNIDDLFKNASVRTLYDELHRLSEKIDSAVWRKVGSQSAR